MERRMQNDSDLYLSDSDLSQRKPDSAHDQMNSQNQQILNNHSYLSSESDIIRMFN